MGGTSAATGWACYMVTEWCETGEDGIWQRRVRGFKARFPQWRPEIGGMSGWATGGCLRSPAVHNGEIGCHTHRRQHRQDDARECQQEAPRQAV